jgi:dihydropteroate synthase
MGILNVTPDSFSDGGRWLDLEDAVEYGNRMIGEGADIIDIGGESTRPGSDQVDEAEEIRRVIPVIERLAGNTRISVDTSKPEVARLAIAAGAELVNDVTALGSAGMASLCAETGTRVCLMHMKGNPKTMQVAPHYDDVVDEVIEFLQERVAVAENAGIARENIWIDPGIGFGKNLEHNLRLLANLDRLCALGTPVVVGVSRKSFIGRINGTGGSPAPMHERLEGSLAAQVFAQIKGASVIRTHDVTAARRAIDVVAEISQY